MKPGISVRPAKSTFAGRLEIVEDFGAADVARFFRPYRRRGPDGNLRVDSENLPIERIMSACNPADPDRAVHQASQRRREPPRRESAVDPHVLVLRLIWEA